MEATVKARRQRDQRGGHRRLRVVEASNRAHVQVVTLLHQRDMARRLEVYEETDRRLRQALSPLIPEEPVIVFGSLTKTGVFHDRTDVDLALETEPAALGALRLIGELRERLDRPVDLVLLAGCRFREELV